MSESVCRITSRRDGCQLGVSSPPPHTFPHFPSAPATVFCCTPQIGTPLPAPHHLVRRRLRATSMPIRAPCQVCCGLEVVDDLQISIAKVRERAQSRSPCRCCSFLWQAISDVTEDDTVHPDISYDHILFKASEHGDRLGKGPLHGHLASNKHLGGRVVGHDLQFYTLPGRASPLFRFGCLPK